MSDIDLDAIMARAEAIDALAANEAETERGEPS